MRAGRPARLSHTPLALSDETGGRVADATHAAAAHGVHAGMTLREAIARCPTLSVLEPRPALVARYEEALVTALSAVSPLVEESEPRTVYADLRGTAGLYPAIDDVGWAAFAGVPLALHPRLGIAGHRLTARIAAARAKLVSRTLCEASSAARNARRNDPARPWRRVGSTTNTTASHSATLGRA